MIKKFLISIFLLSFSISVFACWAETCTCGPAINIITYTRDFPDPQCFGASKLNAVTIDNKKYYYFLQGGKTLYTVTDLNTLTSKCSHSAGDIERRSNKHKRSRERPARIN